MRKPLVEVVWGTRPEHVKLFPVVRDLLSRDSLEVRTVFTGQHKDLVDHANLPIEMDEELGVMSENLDVQLLLAKLLVRLDVLAGPEMVVVEGDTSTALAGALAAFYANVPVAHVEAGLTSGDLMSPFPEEMHRRLIRELSALHFAPTYRAANNLRKAGVDVSRTHVTGNTVVDALDYLAAEDGLEIPNQESSGEVLVTIHRRENEQWLPWICRALDRLQKDLPFRFVMVAHPRVEREIKELLKNVLVVSPMDYLSFVKRMSQAEFVITDSGGLQEEGTVLGIPVFVVRENTERQEAVDAGRSVLVGIGEEEIVHMVELYVPRLKEMGKGDRGYIYGDGHAAERIGDAIEKALT